MSIQRVMITTICLGLMIGCQSSDPSISFSFLVIGDFGFKNTSSQWAIANAMMNQAVTLPSLSHVISVGDNFYAGVDDGGSGVDSIDDLKWRTHWYDIYKRGRGQRIESIPWMGVLGNHDYCRLAQAQIDYSSHGWKMDGFFWINRQLDDQVAFVYIDTNLIAYGQETNRWLIKDCPAMLQQFRKSGLSQDQHLSRVASMLDSVQDAVWIVVIGHHPLGIGKCGGEGRLVELERILESKRASVYFYGHVHASGYAMSNSGVAHVLSGAGADPSGRSCDGRGGAGSSVWDQSAVPSFVLAEIQGDALTIRFIDQWGGVQHQAKSKRR